MGVVLAQAATALSARRARGSRLTCRRWVPATAAGITLETWARFVADLVERDRPAGWSATAALEQ
jgi:hypothetical protein